LFLGFGGGVLKGSNVFSNVGVGLDNPIDLEPRWVLKKSDKFMSIILHEDQSAEIRWKKWPGSYTFTIKGISYFMVPHALIGAKFPMIIHSYNNPMPHFVKFEVSKISAKSLMSSEEFLKLSPEDQVIATNLVLDGESVNLAFNTRVFGALYWRGGLTGKALLLIIGAVLLAIVIILQLTGVIHLNSLWGGK
jgi:hypothetical protein